MIRFATSVPSGYHNDFEGYLYNQNLFLSLKEGEGVSFYALDDSRRAVLAQIRFIICRNHSSEDIQAISLPQSPFGSLEFSDALNRRSLHPFMVYMLHHLKERQVQCIEILHHAVAYNPVQTKVLSAVLHKVGFQTSASVTNHHIEIDKHLLEHKMHCWEIRKLKKCRSAGFSFAEVPGSQLKDIYNFICCSRENQGRILSLAFDELKRFVSAIPQAYHLFAVYDKNRMIAAAITVRVNKYILYTFYYAALAAYNNYSPTVRLLEGIYQFCQKGNITVMDLGTSPSDAVRRFKSQMGGIVSDKFTFSLTLLK